MTGRNTVPNIYINGKNIGGCNETLQLAKSGELRKLLDEGGILHNF
jgi:glutaredoxin 3